MVCRGSLLSEPDLAIWNESSVIRKAAWRIALVVGWCMILLTGNYFLRDTYRSEALNYNNRVFAYFEVMAVVNDTAARSPKSLSAEE